MQDVVRSVTDFLAAIHATKLMERQHAHVRVWFRGQCDEGWALRPGIYRDPIDKLVGALAAPLQRVGAKIDEESERIILERHLTQDFQVEAAGLLSGHESRQELYFLEQHYGLPTRLLDWTHRPLAGLWFATSEPQFDDKAGAVFIMDAYDPAVTQGVVPVFRGIATSRNKQFAEEIDAIFDWQDKVPLSFIMPVRPDHSDRRVSRQHSCFTFHNNLNKELTTKHTGTLRKLTVPQDAKLGIRKELFALGMDTFEIYGDLPNLAKRLKEAYNVH